MARYRASSVWARGEEEKKGAKKKKAICRHWTYWLSISLYTQQQWHTHHIEHRLLSRALARHGFSLSGLNVLMCR